ncbi:aminoglycoside phosphotransferase family protein [Pseudoruegeria sp. HB172150]|uniref:aminoglycoside phosphotransferase family protein n=1 Tax=Pseudoruegeria sp. HB172150 TaxID=2721164 RepID=UPI0015582E85|nr:aminoglycoside phosphotransferase family protein [Pseudoruegeria sp. HB172150]
MTLPNAQLSRACADWQLSDRRLVAETAVGWVYRVIRADGSPAALKIARPGVDTDEENAASVLRTWDGTGAVRLLEAAGDAVLLEWLDGPLLGDLARDGQDDAAAEVLAGVAVSLHRGGIAPPDGLMPLERYFRTLLDPAPRLRLSGKLAARMEAGRALACACLAAQGAPKLLHGDLHHDNVMNGPRGWVVIDPKGLLGDPAYELANALRNPVGLEPEILKLERIRHHTDIYAQALDIPKQNLLNWAAAHCALSLSWTLSRGGSAPEDEALLPILLSIAEIPT